MLTARDTRVGHKKTPPHWRDEVRILTVKLSMAEPSEETSVEVETDQWSRVPKKRPPKVMFDGCLSNLFGMNDPAPWHWAGVSACRASMEFRASTGRNRHYETRFIGRSVGGGGRKRARRNGEASPDSPEWEKLLKKSNRQAQLCNLNRPSFCGDAERHTSARGEASHGELQVRAERQSAIPCGAVNPKITKLSLRC